MFTTKNYSIKKIGFAALALFMSLSVGCFGQIDQAFDCSNICKTFEQCFDSNFDTESCTNDCRNKAKEDQDFADQADACENCIDQKACSEDFVCIDECFEIVP